VTSVEWLKDLALEGWQFRLEDGRLRYRAPSDAARPDIVERLRARRDEIADLVRQAPDELAIAPLSYGQRALWFLWQLAPESTAYHQSMPLSIDRAADPDVWRAAARLLVARHPVLRTRYPLRRGEPLQQVLSDVEPDWAIIDAAGWSDDETEAAVATAHASAFDLSARPPVRFRWVARGGRAPLLLVTMHHIACDAWSNEILRRDLGAMAATLAAGARWTAAPPARTYLDFVRWQRALVEGPAGDRLWAFWQDQLAGPPPRLDLPTDRPRPPIQSYAGDSVRVEVPAPLAAALHALASSRGVTRHVLLLTAFAALLHRWTRQRDFVIGVPAAGRSQPEFADIAGYFVDPLAVRIRVDDDATLAGLLAEVKRASADALAHADFPFALIVERLRVDRDPSRSPIFDVTFNFLSRRAAAAGAPDCAPAPPEMVEIRQADGKFDLTLSVIDDDDGMHAALGFNTDLFDRATIERAGAWLVGLLGDACRDPDRPIDALSLGGDQTPRPVLEGRARDITALRPVHEQILARAARAPDDIAVVAEDGRLTYAELDRRTAALADALAARGVGPGATVGLTMPRTSAFVVGLLATLRAGGAFVPLDAALPAALRQRMLRQAGARVAIEGTALDIADVDDAMAIAGASGPDGALDRLAYVIFTSGSTGVAKGVAVDHRALANYTASIVEDLAIAPGARHALVSTIGADLGHTVIFPALVTGGTLHVVPEATVTDAALFAHYLDAHAIDYLKIVPSHLAALAGAGAPVLPRKGLFLGGESSGRAWVARLAGGAACRVFNHYGPTETTVGVMTSEWSPARPPAAATLPLDRAVANTRIWLLDDARRPVPPGVPGELWVTGPCLARGYVGEPARTAERFVDLPGIGRAYRTGDLARQLPGGGLLVLGREDRQVKLRGHRIELAQVEAAIAGHPDVGQAVVLPDRDGPGASALVAWVVPAAAASSAAALPDTLEAWLADRLPFYMVPTRVAVVDRVPVTANGKIDTPALRALLPPPAARVGRRPPRDLVELRLRQIWMDVLGVDEVGLDDDFFHLGGHSLLAVRMASLIFDTFDRRLPLAALFTHRTLQQMAGLLRRAAPTGRAAPLVSLRSAPGGAPLVLFPGAGGSLAYFQPLVDALGGDVAVWGAQAIGLDDDGVMPRDVPALAGVYAEAIVREPSLPGPHRLAGHSFGGLVAFEVARQLRARGEDVALVGVIDNPAPGVAVADPERLTTERDWLVHIARRIERLYGVELGLADAQVEDLGHQAQVEDLGHRAQVEDPGHRQAEWLVERLLAAGVLPPGTSLAFFRRYVDLYRANVEAAARYRPEGPPADVPVTLFVAREVDPALGRPSPSDDPTLGWAAASARPVTVVPVDGTHVTMLTAPQVGVLGRRLRTTLDRALVPARVRLADSGGQS